MTVPTTGRLSRLLALVPYLLDHEGVPVAEAARHFDITEAQLVSDLELLFVCGTPGHLPDDLIEAEWDEGRVYLRNADAISRPLRLSVDEALALIAGLRTLAEIPGHGGDEVIHTALTKLAAATGDSHRISGDLGGAVDIDLGGDAVGERAPVYRECQEALAGHRRVHLTYLVPHRDESTERDVDPMRLLSIGGHWYLEGWCHRAEDVRTFRLDRILSARLLDQDGTPPATAHGKDLDQGLFTPSPEDQRVVLELAPSARWVAERYPVEEPRELDGDRLEVVLRTPDTSWLRRLVLSSGGRVRITGPVDLARRAEDWARGALELYAAVDAGRS